MSNTFDDADWILLLRRIKDGKCTPFLGAGTSSGVLPLGSDIALQWAQQYGYPLEDCADLPRVAQYLAIQFDPMFPKEEIIRQFFRDPPVPDFTTPHEPHNVLAELPLPVYITTNYDDFMTKALTHHHKNPRRELCRWNSIIREDPSVSDMEPTYEPTPANPVVFHLHGHSGRPDSLVLTEDDYLDFLVNISSNQNLLAHQIQRAITGSSLLFVGYSLADITFKVIFRGLVSATEASLRRISITVQLPHAPTDPSETTRTMPQNLREAYFEKANIRVFWGTAEEFCGELRRRWEGFSKSV